jgi:hypothetical protein
VILYKVPIPLLGSPGAPYFKGTNITEFLERFKEICEDYRVEDSSEKLKRLPKYYTIMISQSIKNTTEWIEEKWEELKKELLVEFKVQDMY